MDVADCLYTGPQSTEGGTCPFLRPRRVPTVAPMVGFLQKMGGVTVAWAVQGEFEAERKDTVRVRRKT